MASFSTGRRGYFGSVVCDVYYSATVSKRLCIAGPAIRLARKNAKYSMKLSATCHAALGKGVVSRGEAAHTRPFLRALIRQCIVFAHALVYVRTYIHEYLTTWYFLAAHSIAGYLHQYDRQI